MNTVKDLLDRLRTEITATSTVRQAAERWHHLTPHYYDAPEGSVERRRIGALIADCVEEISDGIEQSTLASWVGFVGQPDRLRCDAAAWRRAEIEMEP
ncbi:hypothetical protein K1W54_04335 [Micromonospora sp. CPCC 205371]|nr:hypothetical protein [Micromonospora sp. CPCC 205371]